jgi:voltage-gated potassium channel
VTRYQAWTRRTEKPLLVLAVLFLIVLAAPILDPTLPASITVLLAVANVAIWAAFAVDYVVRLVLVDDRRRFIRTHLVDLAAVALPALRPLRLLRLLSVGHMLARRGQASLAGQAARLVAGTAALLTSVGAIAILDVERNADGANITSIEDAFWWACTTITTVGYGDRYPVTLAGRVIAVGLMVVGIALLGVLTASIAAWFVRQVSKADEANLVPVEAQLAALEAKVDALTALLRRQEAPHA